MAIYKVTACGLTKDNRPHVVIEDEYREFLSRWYHSRFYRVDDALDYLKDLYREGISQNDLKQGWWLTLQQLQELGD